MSAPDSIATIERILDRGGDADDVLRDVVATLVERGGCVWAGILFAEGDELMLGPEAGSPLPGSRLRLPVMFDLDHVADLVVDGCSDTALAERVAELIPPFCLVGWDTGGVPWDELGSL